MKKINIQEFLKSNKKINPQELLNKITQNKNMLILSSLVILLILYLDFSFGLKTQQRALQAISPKIVNAKKDLEQLKLDSIRMRSQAIVGKPGQVKEIVPSGQMALAIEEISRMANQQGVEIFQIKPQRKSRAFVSSRGAPQQDEYSPVLIDLEVSGGYHQLGRFLAELENFSVLLVIEELNVMHSKQTPSELKVKLQVKTYMSE
jgi:Tfp pilus assembly protein PilO